MARLPRLVIPHQPHHIIQQGNDSQYIYRDTEDYQQFLTWLRESAREFKVAVHAYVLMPNHFHLLATPSTERGLAQMMQRIGRYYVPWYNARHQRTGSLFQGRFKTSLIDAAAYFLKVSHFVEMNPVRTGVVADSLEYPWSSYHHHAGMRVDPVITDHALYWALGNTPFQREANYIDMCKRGCPRPSTRASKRPCSRAGRWRPMLSKPICKRPLSAKSCRPSAGGRSRSRPRLKAASAIPPCAPA